MRISAISIFPSMFQALTDYGIVSRAIAAGLLEFEAVDLRPFGQTSHRHLDDRPFGGGPGMVMLAEPIVTCVETLKQTMPQTTPVIHMSPQGHRLTHKEVCDFATMDEFIVLCGRYEGIDQRALDIIDARDCSIGDYVLSGGELAAMVLIDAIVRQIPGALGNEQSTDSESFANGLLDFVHYTRPQSVNGLAVPPVLLSGDHAQIDRWRLKQSIGRTWLRRPDLLESMQLTDEQHQALKEFQDEYQR